MKLTLGDISIASIGPSSGIFIGQKNTHKKFHSEVVINEVVGELSGNKNTLLDNDWLKTKHREDD